MLKNIVVVAFVSLAPWVVGTPNGFFG